MYIGVRSYGISVTTLEEVRSRYFSNNIYIPSCTQVITCSCVYIHSVYTILYT